MTFNNWSEAPESGEFTVVKDSNDNFSLGIICTYDNLKINRNTKILKFNLHRKERVGNGVWLNIEDVIFHNINEENKKLKEIIKEL